MSSVRWEAERPVMVYGSCERCGAAWWDDPEQMLCPTCLREDREVQRRVERGIRLLDLGITISLWAVVVFASLAVAVQIARWVGWLL